MHLLVRPLGSVWPCQPTQLPKSLLSYFQMWWAALLAPRLTINIRKYEVHHFSSINKYFVLQNLYSYLTIKGLIFVNKFAEENMIPSSYIWFFPFNSVFINHSTDRKIFMFTFFCPTIYFSVGIPQI